jgi:hypothetical protein
VAPAPNWVKQKPIESPYYSGIGMAIKSSPDYLAIAKNNALNDLASEISVQIKSSSVLYQVENNDRFREEFKANTQLSSIENIEGFELVDSYENNREYWVYYRLSKSEYAALKKQRKDAAISRSLDLYDKANEFKLNAQYDDALIYGIKALEAIKPYLGDGLQVEHNSTQMFLGNELFNFLNTTVNEINIRPILGDFEITRGKTPNAQKLAFLVCSEEFKSLADVPIYFFYSGHRIKNNELYSSYDGTISYPLTKITSTNPTEYLQANLNMVSLTKEATDDPIISQLMGRISGSEARIKITVNKPRVLVQSAELSLSDTLNENILATTFKREFLESQFKVTQELANADYILKIEASTKEMGNTNGFFSTALNANIKLYSKELNLLYTHQINNLKGVQLDYQKASIDAYQKASEQIEKFVFRQMRRKVFE